MNLVPGFTSITYTTSAGTSPLLRGANTDINTALALALISFCFVTYYGLKDGKLGFLKQFVNVGRFFKGLGQLFTGKFKSAFGNIGFGFIDIVVSFLEVISYFIRIVSFTFRLFGNMTGGEILILILFFLLGFAGFGLIQVGYIFEVVVGVVQALIFSGLTLVFVTMAAEKHEGEHSEGT
jgi:F-type H+-transporting ATPase subunit a